jgi:STE24 endopeptidase
MPAAVHADTATQAYLATIPAGVRTRSDAYTEGGYWLILWGVVVAALVTVIIVRSKILVRVRNWASAKKPRLAWAGFACAVVASVVSWLIELPWVVYTDWVRETNYGLSRQPFLDWFGQQLIWLTIAALVFGLAFMAIYALMRRSPQRWWLYGGGASGVFILLMMLVAPVYIMPLFNKYEPFPAGPVKDAIVQLARTENIPADKIFVYDGSRQRSVVTANVAGILGSARIAVSDVALKETSLNEVRAVVGHEMGHYALGHSYKGAIFFALLIMLGFYVVHKLYAPFVRLFGTHGIGGIADPAGLPVLLFVLSLVLTLATPLTNAHTRIGETEADNYSLRVARDPDGLSGALIKTVEYRKAAPGPVEEFLFHTHPSVKNRVHNAMVWKQKNAGK